MGEKGLLLYLLLYLGLILTFVACTGSAVEFAITMIPAGIFGRWLIEDLRA
jgi:hypothetical protein